ncbi:MAG: hypothetical protein IKI19_00370 [Prevotella sp.]|nr:hypothetical protein [Prevotella sp.]
MNCNNEQLNFTCGGDQQLYVTLRREGQAFPAELSDDVVLNIVSERAERINVNFQVGDDGKLLAMLPAEKFQQPGSYGVEVVGLLNGTKWRAWRKRCIRYTPDTQPGSPRSSEQQADPYDITIDVGLVQDIIPRRTSELVNDGEDGNDPFAKAGDVAEALKRYAPLESPKFTGNPVYDDFSSPPDDPSFVLASKNWVRRSIEWFKTQANGIASLVNGKVPAAQIPDLPYIPSNKKGVAGGVAELNGDGKVPTAQAQFALRGNLVAADIDSTTLQTGFYRIIGQRLGADILGGDEANGVLIQYSDGYKEQVLHVGRTAGAAAGEQVETYTRRYLPTPKRWTAWSKGGGGEPVIYDVIYNEDGDFYYTETECYDEYEQYRKQNIPVFFRIVSGSCPADANKLISLSSNDVYFFLSDKQYGTLLYDWVFLKTEYFGVGNKRIQLTRRDIKQILPIRFSKSSSTVSLNWRDETITSFTDANTTYKAMTAAQANAGTATTELLISPKVLADYIRDRIKSSISQYYLIELNKIGENQYEVDDPSVVEEAIEGLNNRDVLKCQVEVKLPSGHIFSLVSFMDEMLWFSYASAEESVIYEVQISRNPDTGACSVDYFMRLIPSE